MKRKNVAIRVLLMLMLSTVNVLGQGTDTIRSSAPATDQTSHGGSTGNRQMLEDTGGKSGLRGKSDTERSINGQNTSRPVKDMRSNDKYFSIGAAVIIGIVLLGLIRRYRERR